MATQLETSVRSMDDIDPPRRFARLHAVLTSSLRAQAERATLITDAQANGRDDPRRRARIAKLQADIQRSGFELEPAERDRIWLAYPLG